MCSWRFPVSILVFLACFLGAASPRATAKSLYLLRHNKLDEWGYQIDSPLFAFEIVDDELVFHKQVDIPLHGYGPIDIAIDDDADVLFISSETSSGYNYLPP